MNNTVAKQHSLQQKCLKKWIGSVHRNTTLQRSTLYTSAQTTHSQYLEILLIYYMYISLSWSCNHFVFVAMNMGQYCDQGDD